MCVPDLQDILVDQMRKVHEVFPDLIVEKGDDGGFVVTGTLGFQAAWNGTAVQDSYQIEISIPSDFPRCAPSVKETGGRIPKDFHRYTNSALCLAAPLAVCMTFAADPTLAGYLQKLVVPFLFSCSYKERFGTMPYGELAHGGEGLLQYYKGLFTVRDEMMVLGLLKILATRYRGHIPCPCKSGKRLRACHGPLLLEIKRFRDRTGFLRDFGDALIHVRSRVSPERSDAALS